MINTGHEHAKTLKDPLEVKEIRLRVSCTRGDIYDPLVVPGPRRRSRFQNVPGKSRECRIAMERDYLLTLCQSLRTPLHFRLLLCLFQG